MIMKKLLAGVLAFCMTFSLVPKASAVGDDIEGHWAQPYIEYLNEKKVILPAGTSFNPDQKISRAELMRYLNRAFNFTESTEIDFDDIMPNEEGEYSWYYNDVKIAVKHGYIEGTGNNNMSPLNYLTREQAATIIGRLHKAEPTDDAATTFVDKHDISSWAAPYINTAVSNNYINGYTDNTFKPQNNITRGEIARILYAFCGTIIDEEGTYTDEDILQNVDNITITTGGVLLEDTVIDGNLYITEGVLSENVTLTDVEVKGDLIISGGNVTLDNVLAGDMIVSSGTERILSVTAKNGTTIDDTEIQTAVTLTETGIDQNSSGFKNLDIQTTKTWQINLNGLFNNVDVNESATINLIEDASIIDVEMNAGATIKGVGTIQMLKVNEDGSDISAVINAYEVAEGVDVIINGQSVDSSHNTAVIPISFVFDKRTSSDQYKDIEFTVRTSGGKLTHILYDEDKKLTAPSDYSLSGSKLILEKETIEDMPLGEYELTFVFDEGDNAIVKVNIQDTARNSLTPSNIDFNKEIGSDGNEDVVVNIMPAYGAILREIEYLGTQTLVLNQDYSIDGNEITIDKSFFEGRSTGSLTLDFIMSTGNVAKLYVDIIDTTPPTAVMPERSVFDTSYSSEANRDVELMMTLAPGDELQGIRHNGALLIEGTEYTYDEDTGEIIVKRDYLNKQQGGIYVRLDFDVKSDDQVVAYIDYVSMQEATFNVEDTNGKAIEGANIVIDNMQVSTNEKGEAVVEILPGTYQIRVYKTGYFDVSQVVEVKNQRFETDITMLVESK